MKFPVKLARSIVVCAFLAGISASVLSEGKEYVILKNPIANADNYSVGLKAMNVSKADFENFLKTPEAAELLKVMKLPILFRKIMAPLLLLLMENIKSFQVQSTLQRL